MVACMPSAWPLWVEGKFLVRMAGELAASMAPPTAWKARKPINQPIEGASPHRAELTKKKSKANYI